MVYWWVGNWTKIWFRESQNFQGQAGSFTYMYDFGKSNPLGFCHASFIKYHCIHNQMQTQCTLSTNTLKLIIFAQYFFFFFFLCFANFGPFSLYFNLQILASLHIGLHKKRIYLYVLCLLLRVQKV